MEMQTIQQKGIEVPVDMIVQGKNPRTYFDPAAQKEMDASVKALGICQPLLLRPLPSGKLELVAGERRFRSAMNNGFISVPALIREIPDEEVERYAFVENTQREDMSPTEEAESAARILAQCGGDREETAKRMGWASVTTLDKYLALLNCSENVRKALTERKIKLGHAELLAGVPRDKQDKALGRLLGLPTLPSVAELRTTLEALAQNLDTACFDKTECIKCPHNSGVQQALFQEAIEGAKCGNGECFTKKTEGHLQSIADNLKEEYPVIRIVRSGDNYTTLKLIAEGDKGVGEEQASQCRGCAKFGAAISAVPGKIGNVYRDQCFDPVCNAKCVAARIKSEATASAPVSNKQAGSNKAATTNGAKKPANSTAPSKVTLSQPLKEYRQKVWRGVFKLEAQKPEFKHTLLLTLALTGKLGKVDNDMLGKAFCKVSQQETAILLSLEKSATAVAGVATDTIQQWIGGIAAACYSKLDEGDIKKALLFMQSDIGLYWKLNGEYLQLLTKSEIQVVANELGIAQHVGDGFSKMMSGKKDEIIKALLSLDGYDYQGKVPKHLLYTSAD